ncbi:polyketide cyclase [Noviherbaspirillum cavernae]|uniref:Polyketide cyclase n=1 Tax=Noviherbaspirillum cavernae TaxID=2320862 RepID=A0A418WVF7_9BURK|nr:SRPBCC family protein [Noviherbaspirillum cavernae]RJF96541.1 polyketide cyclase [Noviherbaspirillum cavernae]
MLKIIGISLVGIVGIVVIVLALAATRPDTFRVQRTTSIQATPEKIFPHINDLRRFSVWSPYDKKDPAMQRTYSGAASGKGAAYAWEGNGEVGKGRMEIAESAAPAKVTIKLDFIKPFEAHNMVDFTLIPQGDATEVTWSMQGPAPYLARIMHLFFDMDKMVGKDFEVGLADLKVLAEK